VNKATIVFNPAARNARRPEQLLAAAAALKTEGWEVGVLTTSAPGHATDLAREASAAGARVVFACGGDGTVNEVANGLAGGETALGVIRGGTGNVFAKEVGVPRAPADALRVLVDGEEQRFDLGVAGGRYFLLMAGVGFDASVVRRVPDRFKRLLGTASYALWGATEALRFRGREAIIRIEGEEKTIDLFWMVLGNTRSYGGIVDITFRALADDGLLDAYVFAGRDLPWVLTTGARIALGRHHAGQGVSFYRAATVEVSTPGLPVQGDGEYFGETPMAFSVAPRALTVRLPRGGARRLLATPEGFTPP
jgi:diacylglycerol kinase (ATP)